MYEQYLLTDLTDLNYKVLPTGLSAIRSTTLTNSVVVQVAPYLNSP